MNRRTPLPDGLAAAPFSYREGLESGLTAKNLRHRSLDRPFHGTRDPRVRETIASLCETYATQMDERAFFSSITAAQLMGIPLPPRHGSSEAIHVAIVSPHRGLEGVRVIGHKVQLMGGDSWTRDGLIMSTPARAWCELGVLLSIPELVAAGDFIIRPGHALASHLDLIDAVQRYPDRRAKRKLRGALTLLDGRAESPMESQLRVILNMAGVVGLVPNLPIRIAGRSYRIDLAIPTKKVAIEYQGDYHRDKEQYRHDMTRRSRIESDGWRFIEVNADDIRDPVDLVDRIRALIPPPRP